MSPNEIIIFKRPRSLERPNKDFRLHVFVGLIVCLFPASSFFLFPVSILIDKGCHVALRIVPGIFPKRNMQAFPNILQDT